MIINCINGKYYDSNIYIINGENPTIIDCGTGLYNKDILYNMKRIIEITDIKQIIITHEHYDHCGGVKKLYDSIGRKALIISHDYASEKIEKGESTFASMIGGKMPKIPVDIRLKEGDHIKIGNDKFNVIHTPGHSPGSMCLYCENTKSLISGDTIFAFGSFGRYDFQGGDLNLLKESIKRLSFLEIKNLYPGHEAYIEVDGQGHVAMAFENIQHIG